MKRMEPSDCHHYLAPYDPGDPGATLSKSVLCPKKKNSQADRPCNSKTGPTFLFSCIYRMRSFWLVMMPEKSKCSRIPRFCVSKGRDKKDKQTLQAFLGADIHNTKESTPSAASSNVNIKFGEMLTNM